MQIPIQIKYDAEKAVNRNRRNHEINLLKRQYEACNTFVDDLNSQIREIQSKIDYYNRQKREINTQIRAINASYDVQLVEINRRFMAALQAAPEPEPQPDDCQAENE